MVGKQTAPVSAHFAWRRRFAEQQTMPCNAINKAVTQTDHH